MATTSFSPYAAVRAPSASSFGRHLDLSRHIRLPLTRPPAPAARWGARRHVAPFRLAARRLSVRCGALVQIDQSEFPAEVLGSDIPVLVEFVADWCGPCRLISSVVEWASQVFSCAKPLQDCSFLLIVAFQEYKGRLKVVKIDHDANPKLITEYKVYGLPALILFKNGQEVPESRREGAITKVKLKEYLDNFLEPTSVI
ncbi:hypothetical protein BHM03_00027398 [Ensete ventricosum]|nr:hypothetical protein BHM03_00027398 [Ensete ventricosum]